MIEDDWKRELIACIFFVMVAILIAYFGQFAIFPLSIILFLVSLSSLLLAGVYFCIATVSASKLIENRKKEKKEKKENNDK